MDKLRKNWNSPSGHNFQAIVARFIENMHDYEENNRWNVKRLFCWKVIYHRNSKNSTEKMVFEVFHLQFSPEKGTKTLNVRFAAISWKLNIFEAISKSLWSQTASRAVFRFKLTSWRAKYSLWWPGNLANDHKKTWKWRSINKKSELENAFSGVRCTHCSHEVFLRGVELRLVEKIL